MPFYEYECKSCGHELEAMQKVSDPPLRKCPECGKSQLTRLMSAPVFRLKGGGWYETDFKGDKDSQRNLADRPDVDAPKDAKGDSAGKDEKGKEGEAKTAEAKPSEAPSAKEPAAKEKPADKSAEKSSGGGAVQKPKAANRSSRGGRLKKKSIKVKRRR
jgi:putative FmdB family regulatory protein